MATLVPIRFHELFKLTNLGINSSSITFTNLTMESDKFICVREKINDQASIAIVEVENQQLTRNRINAESAIMNPSTRILALRSGSTLQIFNLDLKSKMKEYTSTEPVIFWKWISVNTIAVVTATSVFHWSMEEGKQPRKVFERLPAMSDANIINYRVDKSEKWCILIGLQRQPDNTMKGAMQLYSVERNVSQSIEGHAAAFVDFKMPGSDVKTTVISIAASTAQGGKLFVMEVPASNKPANAPVFTKRAVPINFAPQDFPVAMQASEKYGTIFLITRAGFLNVYDAETATLIYSNRITQETIFVTTEHTATGGLIGVNRLGQVLVVSVDESTIVPYTTGTLRNLDLAIAIASRANLPGADDLFIAQFNKLLAENNVEGAIKVAIEAPNNILRTRQVVERLQAVPVYGQNKPAISIYFQTIIERSKLNPYESLELARIVLQKPGGAQYLKSLFETNKLEGSEELGDLIRPYDAEVAMKLYAKGGAHAKIIGGLLERGEYQKVLTYCERVGYQPDYLDLVVKLMNVNPDAAVNFALVLHGTPSRLDSNTIVDILVQRNLVKQATAYLLDVLQGNKPEEAALQTKLLEINLLYSPVQVADRILADNIVSHFDRQKIATMCEKVGLYQRALENYKDINDIRRVIVNTHIIPQDWLVNYFGNLSEEEVLTCLKELLSSNMRQNLQIVVQAATKYNDLLTPRALVPLFEGFKSYEGLFYYLGAIVNFSEDPEVHFKYIEAATRMGQLQEVERITRESNCYDPVRTKDFLKEVRLSDQWPLINVCDKYGFEEELVRYLYTNNMLKFVELYVGKRKPIKAPVVVGALLDVDCSEEFVRNLIMSVGAMCPVEPLVAEVEKRNRLKILHQWLEARVNEGNQEPATHNALAKIYIDLNHGAEQFLLNNDFYDPRVVGKYCERRDPHLAFVAYQRGQCDAELVDVATRNNMFKRLAKYLVERQSPELWAHVLQETNPYRRQLVDQVVQSALPNTSNSEEISATVKAFMPYPKELIELLEKIVLSSSKGEFKDNRNLQNLLILTAIKADTGRVRDYIKRLDKYDAPDIATIAVGAGLFEEAFEIYNKFGLFSSAVRVLLDNLADVRRASDYAERVSQAEVWSILGRAQLHNLMIEEAIGAFIKADDPSAFMEVIAAAERTEQFSELIRFLQMARRKLKDSNIDSALCYAYARTNRFADLEEFVSSPNTASLQAVGDRCYEENIFEAARIFFGSISNYGRLASTLVRLREFHLAFDAARKANNVRVWKEVSRACVDANEFRLAQMCGLNIIVHADELEDLIGYYEAKGHFDELISLLEVGLRQERAHVGIFTELGILYAKYKVDRLMDHITTHYKRLNIPKLLNVCEIEHHWAAMRFLHMNYDEFDNAVLIMIEHPSEAWDHATFKEAMAKAVNMELYYKAIEFYLAQQPKLLNDLLAVLSPRIDHERVVRLLEHSNQLPLIKPYLQNVQNHNLTVVNEALNGLFVEEGDYESLRESIANFDNFDAVSLARQLEQHDLLEFRRAATLLYKKNERWAQSIELSKKDKLFSDAMETAAASKNPELAEGLLRYFGDQGLNECFAACLFTCYDLIRPDVALELAWKHKLTDFVMPFMIQVLREYTTKVDELQKLVQERKSAEQQQQQQPHAPAQDIYFAPPPQGAPPVMQPPMYGPPSAYGGGFPY